ncbi:Uncharacterised protein [Mycobacteroides abscessus subsp. massiliense]|nr:Uncharacterised protein [Mycobacteroides abscessus subsp. massiliense]SLI84332.1 Uncharacterised protein [Mycobacteroides abscessus subsp. massiliense]
MTPSDWLQANLSAVIVAVATANAVLAGAENRTASTTAPQEGQQDAGSI